MNDQPTQHEIEKTVEAMTLSEIREIIDTDKTLAMDVVHEAREAIDSFRMIELTPDITGKPDGLDQFHRYKREQQRNLQAVTRSPFFTRLRAGLRHHLRGRSPVPRTRPP